MIYLTAAYAILSALGVVLALVAKHYIAAFCVAFLSAAAIIAGREFHLCFRIGTGMQRIGRLLYAAILLVISVWLARSITINMQYYQMPGLTWAIVGFALGFLSILTLSRRAR